MTLAALFQASDIAPSNALNTQHATRNTQHALPPGAPDSPRFFRVAQQDGVWWLIAPDGKRFFSLGVNVVDQGLTREKYRPDRPGYAAFRYYPDETAWARETLARLRAWGFNTLGAWSDIDALKKAEEAMLPYTVGLWLGSSAGVPWLDVFSAETERTFDREARRFILPRKDDPLLIGYFTDNELGWWSDTIFLYHTQHPGTATYRALVKLLREHYGGDLARLRRDFHTGKLRRFDDLNQRAPLTLKPGGHGREVIEKFTFLIAQRYYRLAHDAIRRYDKNHLILGDRYISWYPPAVARAIRPYTDVVSTNYNADWTDGANARFHFETLHRLTGKPILITEFYFCAQENRSGNKNTGAGFPTVRTQRERAAGFRRNLTAYASLPCVVGAHWFQFYDEPTFGRDDGEDFNMGLVDIEDRPYEKLTAAMTALHQRIPALHARSADSRAEKKPTDASTHAEVVLPPAPPNPETGLHTWDKTRGYVGSTAQLPFADLYACWKTGALYLAVHAGGYVDEKLYAGGKMPESERPEWVLSLGRGRRPLRVRFGPGGPTRAQGSALSCRGWLRSTRSTALVALPPSAFGRKSFQAGDTLRLRAALTGPGRVRRMTWDKTLQMGKG